MGFCWDLPLFPDAAGKPVGKDAMSDTIRQAAIFLDIPLAAPDLSEQTTGHTLRATGAQGLARAGLDLWAVQLLGRWGSEAVKRLRSSGRAGPFFDMGGDGSQTAREESRAHRPAFRT